MATAPITEKAPAAGRGAQSAAAPARVRGLWWKALTGIWMVLAIVGTFLYLGPAEGFPYPDGARTVVLHVPCAWLATLCYVVGAWYAVRFLARIGRGGMRTAGLDDLKCCAAMELGLLFSILTTVTGSLFSRMEWGKYWSWDPRQTSILVICLIFAAYIVLRGAIIEPERRARLSAAYALVAIVPGLFLIWVLPRIVFTLHGGANQAVIGGGLGEHYRLVMYGAALPAFLAAFVWMFQLRVRLLRLEARQELPE